MIKWFGRLGAVGAGAVGARWSPADLFANGEQGSLWGKLPYYSDAADTVEADWGDPVGNIPDASGNGTAWAQVTSTARPILGRVPVGGRRNLLNWTEDLSNPVWGTQNGAIVALDDGVAVIENAVEGAEYPRARQISGQLTEPSRYRYLHARIEAGTTGWAVISGVASTGGIRNVFFNTLTGEFGYIGFNIASYSALQVAAGVLDVFVVLDRGTENAGGVELYIGPAVSGSSGVVSEGASIRVHRASLTVEDSPYQRVGNEYDVTEAGVKGIHYLRFDGTDDQVTTTLPAISGGTIVLAGKNGIWIDSLDFAGGAFSVGPGTYTGGPTGLMAILGDILERGCFVIDRALTPEEIAQVKKYYVARGSAGLIELGPELVVNGTFDENIDGWGPSHADGRVTLSWDDGAIRAVGPSQVSGAQQRGPVLSDVFVVVEGTLVSAGNSSRIRLNVDSATGAIRFESRSSSVAGDRVRSITYLAPTALPTAIYLRGDNPPYDIKWDNISLRKLILPGETP